jgi:hypothetical protein
VQYEVAFFYRFLTNRPQRRSTAVTNRPSVPTPGDYDNAETGGPPVWSSGQSFWLQIQRYRVRFPALPNFLRNRGSGTGSTQPRENN